MATQTDAYGNPLTDRQINALAQQKRQLAGGQSYSGGTYVPPVTPVASVSPGATIPTLTAPQNSYSGGTTVLTGQAKMDADKKAAADRLAAEVAAMSPEQQVARLDQQKRAANEANLMKSTVDQNKLANEFGLSAEPTTLTGVVSKFKTEQAAAMAYAKEQADRQRQLDQAELARTQQQGQSSISANTAAMSQGREGAVSGTALQVMSEYTVEINKRLNEAQIRVQAAQAARDQQIKDLAAAQERGQTELAKSIQQGLLQSEQQLVREKAAQIEQINTQNKQAMATIADLNNTGALTGATDEDLKSYANTYGVDYTTLKNAAKTASTKSFTEQQKSELDNMSAGLKVAQDYFINNGQPIDFAAAQRISQSTKLPVESIMKYNQQAVAIKAQEKTIGIQAAQAELQSLQTKAQNELNGIFTSNAQDVELIKSYYRKGDTESAKLLERKLGVDDLSYQTDLAYKQAQIEYQKSATGENYQNLLKKQAEFNDLYGETSYVPNEGKFNVENTVTADGRQAINVDVQVGQSLDIPGTSRREDWCAAFTNDVLGTSFGDTFKDKMNYARSNGFSEVPAAGMAFIQATSAQWGHVGIVESVDLATGKMSVVEANWQKGSDGKGIVGRRTVNISDAAGFMKPPKSMPTNGESDNKFTVNNFQKEAESLGFKSTKDKKAFVDSRMKEAYGSMTESEAKGFKAYSTMTNENTNYKSILGATPSDEALTDLADSIDYISKGIKDDEKFSTDLVNKVENPVTRRAIMSEMRWIEGNLRDSSGAAITKDEYMQYGRQFFPREGDDAEEIKRKEQARDVATKTKYGAMGLAGQRTYYEQFGGKKTTDTTTSKSKYSSMVTPSYAQHESFNDF